LTEQAKSYEGTSTTGTVKLDGVDPASLQGRHILLVEDIVDTGTY
jgi:hypoxanthine-guanine phosphoribosyltransferase